MGKNYFTPEQVEQLRKINMLNMPQKKKLHTLRNLKKFL